MKELLIMPLLINSKTGAAKQLHQELHKLLIPVLIEQTFVTLMNVINAIMAGHIGKEATAAIGIVDTLNSIFIGLFSALAIGGTVIVAYYTGHGDRKNAEEASKQALYAGVALSLSITVLLGIFRHPLLEYLYGTADPRVMNDALSYLQITLMTYPLIALTSIACGVLRGAGDTRSPAKVVILMNIINIIFSYLFIFGLSWQSHLLMIHFGFNSLGVRGAAMGIAIARIFGAIILIYILVKGTLDLKINRIYKYHPNWDLLKSIFNIGMPAGLESILFNAGKLITQTFIVASGTVAIVANYIGMSIHSLMVLPGVAFSLIAPVLVSQKMGGADRDGARQYLLYLNKLATVSLVIINLGCIPFFALFCSLYSTNHEVIQQTSLLLGLTALFIVFWPVSFILPAGLKGAGDVKYTLILSVMSMWLLRITLGYILCIHFKMGVLGIWIGMYADWIFRGIVFLSRVKSDRWQTHLVVKRRAQIS